MMSLTKIALAGLLCAAGCSFGKPANLETERVRILENWTQNILFPRYDDTIAKLGTLVAKAGDFCAAPSGGGLGATRESWSAARKPWKQAEIFAFGPYKDLPRFLGVQIDSWPVNTGSVNELLAGVDPINLQTLKLQGASHRGFAVVEFLLFETEINLLETFKTDSRRCDYLIAAAQTLKADVEELNSAWRPEGGNYVAEMLRAREIEGDFSDSFAALEEVGNRLGFTLENIHTDKLGEPLGLKTGFPSGKKAESYYSGRSLADILDNLSGIEAVFFDGEEAAEPGLERYLAIQGHDFNVEMRERLASLRTTIGEFQQPLAELVVSRPDKVEALIDDVIAFQIFLQREVLSAMKVSVGFNDTDGD